VSDPSGEFIQSDSCRTRELEQQLSEKRERLAHTKQELDWYRHKLAAFVQAV
jgi:hypothetical protein